MSRQTVIEAGRRAAESRMTETVKVVTRTEVSDPETHDVTPSDSAPIYQGIARWVPAQTQSTESREVGQLVTAQTPELHVPVSAAKLPIGAVAVITASTSDASLVGNEVTIGGRPEGGQTTAHRYAVNQEAR